MRAPIAVGVAVLCAVFVLVREARRAEACGCLSPPEPVGDEDYAVNQQAEQIIFEYEDGIVTAHVLIQYSGAPESFAWIVPVPAVPELELSALGAFGLLEQLTAPAVGADIENICPQSEWVCRYHDPVYCEGVLGGDDDGTNFADAGASDNDAGDNGGGTPGVDVIDRQTVGDYDTVIFDAGDTAAAVRWLQQEGFIVNETMAPYMQPYADMEMLFVAAKLLPGADATAIKPLLMRFPAAAPMVPLVLTAVAAEPHLTVTTYIHGDTFFTPAGHPVVTIDPDRLAYDNGDRFNYPMVLARAIDEAGGDGFVIEYRGSPIVPDFDNGSGCCWGDWDSCGIGDNGQCECPTSPFEADDCAAETDLLEGIALLEALAMRHTSLTRITTRLSPEEMTFDPMYVPDPEAIGTGALYERGVQLSLEACETQIYDSAMYQDIVGTQNCAAVYCGPGTCASTWAGAGCACSAGTVARVFTDLDGQPSVTCVPEVPPVDLEGGGLDLPDACATIDCGLGICVDLNGVPHCQCDGGAAAVTDVLRKLPVCRAIDELTGSPGADDYSEALRELSVCAPPPPTCAPGGWYERITVANPGASCGGAEPLPEQLVPPPAPSCPGMFGCGCRGGGDDAGVLVLLGIGWLALRRRRMEIRSP